MSASGVRSSWLTVATNPSRSSSRARTALMSRRIAVARAPVGVAVRRRRRGVAAGDADRAAVGAADRRLAVGDRLAGDTHLGQRAGRRARGRRRPRSRGRRAHGRPSAAAAVDAEQPLAGRVEADDRPSASTWRMRSVAPSTMAPSSCRSCSSASRSRAPANATASSWRASCATRRPSVVERLVRRRPDGEQRWPAARRDRTTRAPGMRRPVAPASSAVGEAGVPSGSPSARPPPTAATRSRPSPRRRRATSAPPAAPARRTSSRSDRTRELGERPARRDELAQLVLGEQGVRFALGLVERPARVALERLDPGQERGVGRSSVAPASAHSSSRHDDRARVEVPTDRSPSRRASPRRATSGRGSPRIPRRRRADRGDVRRRPGAVAATRAVRSRRRRAPARRGSSCRRPRSGRAGPGRRRRPRASRPTVAASSVGVVPGRTPASRKAVPYSGPEAPPTAATRRCPTARSSSPGRRLGRQVGEQSRRPPGTRSPGCRRGRRRRGRCRAGSGTRRGARRSGRSARARRGRRRHRCDVPVEAAEAAAVHGRPTCSASRRPDVGAADRPQRSRPAPTGDFSASLAAALLAS